MRVAPATARLDYMTYRCGEEVVAQERRLVIALCSRITARSKVLLEKLTVPQLFKKLPPCFTTHKFNISFTTASLLSLCIQFATRILCKIKFNVTPFAPSFSKCLHSLSSPYRNLVCIYLYPCTCYRTRPYLLPLCNHVSIPSFIEFVPL
jgi:hypothetical protein